MMQAPVTGMTIIVELKGGNISINVAKTMKVVLDELGEYYPEMAARILVLNSGFFMQGIWTMLKGLLPKHVIDKYSFPTDVQKELLKIVDDNQLAIYGTKGNLKLTSEYFINKEKKIFKEGEEKVDEKKEEKDEKTEDVGLEVVKNDDTKHEENKNDETKHESNENKNDEKKE
jgi:hypothetical protein